MRNLMCVTVLALMAGVSLAGDGLRIVAWNITNYTGGNASHVQNVAYGEFNGVSLDPDVFLLQEFSGQAALNSFVSHLNSAPGSPGDWAAGQVFANSNINTALCYRTSKLELLDSVLVATGSTSSNPRNIVRYDLRLAGYAGEAATISMYPTHMKAGSSSTDQARRLSEAQKITANVATLPAQRHYVLGGDFNVQSSSQSMWVHLMGSPYNTGPFRDPIRTPGNWNNSFTFRMIHTQDPATQMDDRHDNVVVSPSFGDGVGLEYVGEFDTPWDLSTFADPDHSYRCYGNDGSSFDFPMDTSGNAAVGDSIAQSIVALCSGLGHAPVYLDASVPAVVTVSLPALDFGEVELGQTPSLDLMIGSGGDTALWGALIEDTSYSFLDDPGLIEPAGSFDDAAGGGLNTHTITLTDTDSLGAVGGVLFVTTNDASAPIVQIPYSANVVEAGCPADLNGDGVVDNGDIGAFIALFLAQDLAADFTGDGIVDNGDIGAFIVEFLAGC
ncbi:MAG: GC-type dockerin domain-anchored protein [Phycisphaerales bacterium JB040]